MITKAKVSLASVKSFRQAATEVLDFSPSFNKGIACIEQLLKSLVELENSVKEKISEMQVAKEKLAVTIRGLEEAVARLTAKLSELQDKCSNLESELSSMDSSFTTTDENGEEHEYPNPAYVALEAEIGALQGEISAVEAELYPYEQRLDRAHSVDSQLVSQIDDANSTVYSLNEKVSTCKQLIGEIEDVKSSNQNKSTFAVENLKKIEQIVASYMRIKMAYDASDRSTGINATAGNGGININININKTTIVSESVREQRSYSQEDIEKHQIKFDTDNRISEYEGRKYGGKYNSYDVRIDRTSNNSPILGNYEGIRGESKYIPSNRNAEGIVVINILKKYGLDGIEYRNGEPDFEACATAVVKIKGMTEHRDNYPDENGLPQLGNFSQADIELAKLWNFEEREGHSGWMARDVFNYRRANGLTWHEKCDTETMVLVKSEINAYFKHSGGCSECRTRDAASGNEGGFDE